MLIVKTVYLGGITKDGVEITTFIASTRHKLVYDLNVWFFDYFRTTKQDILELPPLDDWTRSTEDRTFWSVQFPIKGWTVWIRSEMLEFK